MRVWIFRKNAAILLMMAWLMTASLLSGCAKQEPQQEPRSMFTEIRSVNKLVLGRMAISKMATIDDLKLDEAKGMKQTTAALLDAVKLGSRKGAYSYSTYLRAYIDLNELRPEDVAVNEETHTVMLTLPPVRTEFLGRDVQIREDHYRVTGLRSNIDERERAALKEKMNERLKAEVEQKPIYKEKLTTQARAKAAAYFQSLLGKDGYSVTVNFR